MFCDNIFRGSATTFTFKTNFNYTLTFERNQEIQQRKFCRPTNTVKFLREFWPPPGKHWNDAAIYEKIRLLLCSSKKRSVSPSYAGDGSNQTRYHLSLVLFVVDANDLLPRQWSKPKFLYCCLYGSHILKRCF